MFSPTRFLFMYNSGEDCGVVVEYCPELISIYLEQDAARIMEGGTNK